MKTGLRVGALLLAALMGLWAVGHGITLAVAVRTLPRGDEEILQHLIEGSVFLAGGICVISVAVQQLYCWRTHRKDGGLI